MQYCCCAETGGRPDIVGDHRLTAGESIDCSPISDFDEVGANELVSYIYVPKIVHIHMPSLKEIDFLGYIRRKNVHRPHLERSRRPKSLLSTVHAI